MADPAIGQTTASLWETVIGKKPTDNIFNSRALFFALGEDGFKEQADGGSQLEMSLEYATNTTFKSYGELEELDTTRIDVFDAARYQWKISAGTVVWSDLERLRAQVSNRKFDVIAEKLENGKDSLINALNSQMWSNGTGNSSKDIGGLQLLIATDPTTGTVGGINRANFSFWRNIQASGTQSSSSFDNLRSSMRSVYAQCSRGGSNEAPTAAITDRTVFLGYQSLLQANERFAKAERPRGGDLGWKQDAIQFNGADVFYDEDAASGNLYFLNPKFLKLVYIKGAWMKMKDTIEPYNQLAAVQRVFTIANMATNNARRLGVVTSIT
jgi:hypothetical protein